MKTFLKSHCFFSRLRYCPKATKFKKKITHFFIEITLIFQICVAFSEYLNFMIYRVSHGKMLMSHLFPIGCSLMIFTPPNSGFRVLWIQCHNKQNQMFGLLKNLFFFFSILLTKLEQCTEGQKNPEVIYSTGIPRFSSVLISTIFNLTQLKILSYFPPL